MDFQSSKQQGWEDVPMKANIVGPKRNPMMAGSSVEGLPFLAGLATSSADAHAVNASFLQTTAPRPAIHIK